jgi:prevent-host-death family protein
MSDQGDGRNGDSGEAADIAAVPITEARANLTDVVNRVIYRGERVTLTKNDKVVAAVISAEDLEVLNRLSPPVKAP